VHANTSGVFKGFYKTESGLGQFGGSGRNALSRILGEIRVQLPILSRFETSFEVRQEDANALVDCLDEVDVAYIDPPYNQHPYGSNYFMLNLLVEYERPRVVSRVSGIPTNWNRSRYNQRGEVEEALFDLVARCRSKFLLISYNSEGFIPPERFLERLSKAGHVSVLERPYNTFRGSRNLRARPKHVTEFLYLVERR
jgi:adenine-specific DNA-methyltransferase